jgi:hypothetical protein
MDCAQLRQIVLGGGDLATVEARNHLAECPACRELAADGGDLARFLASAESARSAPPLPSIQDLEGQLAAEKGLRGRLASLPTATRWLLTCAVFLVPVIVGLARHRPDIAHYPPARMAMELSAFIGLAFASCWFWLRPVHRPRPSDRIFFVLLGVGFLVPWLIAVLPPAYPSATDNALRSAVACFFFGSALALPIIAVVASLGRRGRGLAGFALLPAVAGALAGLIGLELHCPITSPSHLLAGHAPIALVLPLVWQLAATIYWSRAERPRT